MAPLKGSFSSSTFGKGFYSVQSIQCQPWVYGKTGRCDKQRVSQFIPWFQVNIMWCICCYRGNQNAWSDSFNDEDCWDEQGDRVL